MKKIAWNIVHNSLSIFGWVSFLLFLLMLNFTTTLWVIGLSWYGSSSDYTNPTTTFSWSTSVWTGESLTWATLVTFTQPVQLSAWSVSVLIPSGAQIATSSGGLFNPSEITTATLPTLPVVLPSNEEDVGKIKFWVTGLKLNFSKPVKIQIPVNTTKSTVKIKVKHLGSDVYQTTALSDTYAANCSNGIATPSSDIAPVVSWIATIYTCSASEFVAVVDKVVSTWGWWGWSVFKDNCPGWDFSPSYYDATCWKAPVVTSEVTTSTVENTTVENTAVENTIPDLKTVKYFWYTIQYIPNYKKSEAILQVSKKIILNKKVTKSTKTALINALNKFLVVSYNYDISSKKTQLLKNERIEVINEIKKIIQK